MKKTIYKILFYLLVILLSIMLAILLIGKIDINNLLNSLKSTSDNKVSKSSNFSIYSSAIKTIDNAEIKGLVENIEDDYIVIFKGRHEGELGLEVKGYTSAYVENKNQTFVDCITGKEYDISYINEGDLLVCNGTLIEKSGHFYGFDTKDNKIMFFKKSDLDKIKNNAILNNLTSCSSITIHSIFSNYMYIEFNLEYITNLGEKYTLSFIEKMYYSDISNISGQLSVHNSIKNIKLNIYDITIPDISIISMELN